MSKSSTEYLDKLILDDKGLIIKDSVESIKGYCGLFAFVLSICGNENLTDKDKISLINNIIEASLGFMRKKYEANLDIYNRQASENLESGNLFKSLSQLPAKMREDFEVGLEETRDLLYTEIRDILKILKIDLDL